MANGLVKLINPRGELLCDFSAHSRTINAMAAHPTKSVLVTAGDDTFINIWEISGNQTTNSLNVNLLLSSRVNDWLLTGVGFINDGRSVAAAVYDFKTMLVWEDVV